MTPLTIVKADHIADDSFPKACHAALDALLAKGIMTVVFVGEASSEGRELHLGSHPPSWSLQIGTLTRAAIEYLKPLNAGSDDE